VSTITDAEVRRILDSRGNTTVEVDVCTMRGFASVGAPSGASTGKHEVMAFPRGGVEDAISFFREKVVPEIIGMNALKQEYIDALLHTLDGTKKFSRMGGNVAVATSLAVARAAADSLGIPFYFYIGGMMGKIPYPLGNVLGGGKHAIGGTDIQEFLAISLGNSAVENIFANASVHRRVGEKLKRKLPNTAIGKGDEGAWVAPVDNTTALDIVTTACEEISQETGIPIKPALDVAASTLYKRGKYHYRDRKLNTGEQIDFMVSLVRDYGLHILEDPLHEEDFEGHAELTKKVGDKCLIVGDDLFVTNRNRLEKGIEIKAANAILIKPNQIGTLTDTLLTVKIARSAGYEIVVSHRSGETVDDSIAHLAVGIGAYAIKTGAVGGERIAKLNELIRIEEIMMEG